MPPGGILALDLAGITGVAYGLCDTQTPQFETWVLPVHLGSGAAFVALENELDDAIEQFQPAEVAVEAPLDRAMAATARGKRNPEASYQQFALAGHVESTCYRHRVRLAVVHCNVARKAVLGKVPHGTREEIKSAVMAYWRYRKLSPPDDNAADAGVVWQYRAALTLRNRRIAA